MKIQNCGEPQFEWVFGMGPVLNSFRNRVELPEAVAYFPLRFKVRVGDKFGIQRSAVPIVTHFPFSDDQPLDRLEHG